MFEYYRLPMWSTVGSDANMLDAQGSFELATGVLMAALDGANLIHDVGYLGQGKLGNPASILMGDEMISYAKRVARGFDINEDTLAFDLIRSVGPGGHYLAEKHTIKHHRKELWRPQIANRENMDIWVEQGSRSYEQRLREQALDILHTHQPEPLPEAAAAAIDEIMTQAEEVLARIEFEA
jgi:trimethylamine--corrinoid protein Co-methyltransferase